MIIREKLAGGNRFSGVGHQLCQLVGEDIIFTADILDDKVNRRNILGDNSPVNHDESGLDFYSSK